MKQGKRYITVWSHFVSPGKATYRYYIELVMHVYCNDSKECGITLLITVKQLFSCRLKFVSSGDTSDSRSSSFVLSKAIQKRKRRCIHAPEFESVLVRTIIKIVVHVNHFKLCLITSYLKLTLFNLNATLSEGWTCKGSNQQCWSRFHLTNTT